MAFQGSSEVEPLLTKEDRKALTLLDDPAWADDRNTAAEVERVLLPLAAHYFLIEWTADDRPVDPVARFHLGNGARLERLNFLGDRSRKAMQQAHGLMVNYLYKLEDIVANHEALAQRSEVIASPAVKSLPNQNLENRRGVNGQQGSRPFAQKIGGRRK